MGAMKPRPLEKNDNRADFDCGVDSLNNWLQRHAFHNQKSGASRTYVIYDNEENKIKGYVSLSIGELRRALLPKSRQRNIPDPVPILLLGQLAVDKNYQGMGLARSLMISAFSYAAKASEIIGGAAVITHPINDNVRKLYENWGFKTLEADPKKSMYVRTSDLKIFDE